MRTEKSNPIRATIPVPDHSDLRGFTYRAPTNIEGYNDAPKSFRKRAEWKGQLYHRKGFWTNIGDFFRGKKEPPQRPLSPELVATQRAHSTPSPTAPNPRTKNFGVFSSRPLPREGDCSNLWPG